MHLFRRPKYQYPPSSLWHSTSSAAIIFGTTDCTYVVAIAGVGLYLSYLSLVQCKHRSSNSNKGQCPVWASHARFGATQFHTHDCSQSKRNFSWQISIFRSHGTINEQTAFPTYEYRGAGRILSQYGVTEYCREAIYCTSSKIPPQNTRPHKSTLSGFLGIDVPILLRSLLYSVTESSKFKSSWTLVQKAFAESTVATSGSELADERLLFFFTRANIETS